MVEPLGPVKKVNGQGLPEQDAEPVVNEESFRDPESARNAAGSIRAEMKPAVELPPPQPGARAKEAARIIEAGGSFFLDAEDVVTALLERDPSGKVLLTEVMAQLNEHHWTKSDNVARELLARKGAAWMAALPGAAKVQIVRAVREGRIGDGDFDVFNAVVPLPLGVCSAAMPDEVATAQKLMSDASQQAEDSMMTFESALVPALLERIDDDPDSPVLELVFRRLSFSSSDNVTRKLIDALEARVGVSTIESELARLPLGARYQMVKSLREGSVSDDDRAAFAKLYTAFQRDLAAAGLAALADSAARQRVRDFLVASGDVNAARVVEIAGKRLHRLGRPAGEVDGDQVLLDFGYRHGAVLPLSQGEIDASMTIDRVTTANGEPFHLPGTTIFRPGLAGPSLDPAAAFYLARHTDALVIAYANDDGTHESRLRRAETYAGQPVPDGINMFLVGRPEHMLQSAATGSDVLVGQLDKMQTRGPAIGLNANFDEGTWLVAHSQGNVEAVLTATRLAAAGIKPFAGIFGMSPALHGSPIADNTPTGELARLSGLAIAGPQGYDAIAGLDPDALGLLYMGLMAEALPASEDVSFHGSVNVDDSKAPSLLMRVTDLVADDGLGKRGSDGMVTTSSAGGTKHDVMSSHPDDHMAMIKGGTGPMQRFLGVLAGRADLGELQSPTPLFDELGKK